MTGTWVITHDTTHKDAPCVVYWRGATDKYTSTLDTTVCWFTSKTAAINAFRLRSNQRMTKQYRAVRLSDEEAALVSPGVLPARLAGVASVDEGREWRDAQQHDVWDQQQAAEVAALVRAEEPSSSDVAVCDEMVEGGIVDDLATLADEANRCHAAAELAVMNAVEAAWRSGLALRAAKPQLAHGEWLPWLKANFNGSQQTASRYMRLAENYSTVSNLPSSVAKALEVLNPPKEPAPDLEQHHSDEQEITAQDWEDVPLPLDEAGTSTGASLIGGKPKPAQQPKPPPFLRDFEAAMILIQKGALAAQLLVDDTPKWEAHRARLVFEQRENFFEAHHLLEKLLPVFSSEQMDLLLEGVANDVA
ncbi:DUF3102 domain-containing protein [Mycobacterium sp. 852014-50255_SCH5639931]|uniref:DUF3102 domain-containing protein n=1 Tax=Mycobacterium sp. 852014-50255_SCH5639931 TaxID=1834112 RepID=UPI0007FB985A|nr:DUF3102 domain-containing protein [Mycobacterium sp. 852014-50255_SCH5639931]OBB63653.1 hypothetical protein A5758_21785 [Mycobacterium sp. 852014-50255_SCH5639931]